MIDIDAEIAAARKRLADKTARSCGQSLRWARHRIAIDQASFEYTLGLLCNSLRKDALAGIVRPGWGYADHVKHALMLASERKLVDNMQRANRTA
jgi:hypothetical protein